MNKFTQVRPASGRSAEERFPTYPSSRCAPLHGQAGTPSACLGGINDGTIILQSL